MKKITKPAIGALVAAALVGVAHASVNHRQVPDRFTPLEELTPQQRTALQSRLQILDQYAKIDWDKVVVGVNEKGEIVLKDRETIEMQRVAEPSCWAPY